MSPDGTLDLFIRFRNEGMTLTEAKNQFEAEDWNNSIRESLKLRGTNHPLFQFAAQEGKEAAHDSALNSQCYELWMAGWVTEENGRDDAWAWYWRRPAKGNRKKGKLFLSTNQAFNSYKKDLKKNAIV